METTTNKTIEGNKIIAEFMGAEYKKCIFSHENTESKTRHYMLESDDLNYHASLALLIPVIEKILSIKDFEWPTANLVLSFDTERFPSLVTVKIYPHLSKSFSKIEVSGTSEIEATYQACLQFIEWYNKQPKKS